MCRGWDTKVPGHRLKSLGNTHPPHVNGMHIHGESPAPPVFMGALCASVIPKPCLPLKDLCHLVLVEDEAGMIVPQDSHDAQT